MTTRQEIIDTVQARFSDGRGRAVNRLGPEYKCSYRSTDDGTPCAVGCLLTEDEYTPDMEYQSVGELKARRLLPQRLVPHLGLLAKLQRLHDAELHWDGNTFIAWGPFDKIVNGEM